MIAHKHKATIVQIGEFRSIKTCQLIIIETKGWCTCNILPQINRSDGIIETKDPLKIWIGRQIKCPLKLIIIKVQSSQLLVVADINRTQQVVTYSLERSIEAN